MKSGVLFVMGVLLVALGACAPQLRFKNDGTQTLGAVAGFSKYDVTIDGSKWTDLVSLQPGKFSATKPIKPGKTHLWIVEAVLMGVPFVVTNRQYEFQDKNGQVIDVKAGKRYTLYVFGNYTE